MKNFSLSTTISNLLDTCFSNKKKKKNYTLNNSNIPNNTNNSIKLTQFQNNRAKFTHYNDNIDSPQNTLRLDQEARWTRSEKQLFWNVIRTHIHNLLLETSFGIEQRNLIEIFFSKLDPTSWRDFCRCRDVIRENMWRGEYRKAVIHYLLTKEFFWILFGEDLHIAEEMVELESIYFNAYYVHDGRVRI